MTKDEAKSKAYNTQEIGGIYYVLELIDEIYNDFEEDMIIAHSNIDKAIDNLEKMKDIELNKE